MIPFKYGERVADNLVARCRPWRPLALVRNWPARGGRFMRGVPWVFYSLLVLTFAGCEVGTQQPGQETASAATAAPATSAATADRPGINASVPFKKLARGNLHFVEGYQRGFEVASKSNKPMLLFFTAEWCQFCHQMADEVFTNEQIVALADRFVCILVDADAEPEVCRQFRVQGYPTLLFLSPHGVSLNRLIGKKPGHQVMVAMQAALQSVARRTSAGDPTLR